MLDLKYDIIISRDEQLPGHIECRDIILDD
jgi:hypothetical protein